MKKSLVCATCGFGLLLVLAAAGPAAALPPCSYVNSGNCAAECYPASCYTWSLGTCSSGTASYTFQCAGFSLPGYCSCGTTGGCFLPGTEISLADGSTKPVEAIEAGDLVLAWDEESGATKADAVRGVHDPIHADGYLIVNDRLRFTETHPVLVDGAWRTAGELAVGDVLTAADGSPVVIESIRTVLGPVTVYNFEVDPLGTYVANGIVVHNKKLPEKEWEQDLP
jgi:hypothetical protein